MNTVFGFIGCGNMGGALSKAARKQLDGSNILLANRTPEKAGALADRLGAVATYNADAARRSDYLFLGVKPQMMAGMLSGIHEALKAREKPCVLVTMAAGLSIATIRRMAGVDFPVIRVMPNTPVAIGKGVMLCCGADTQKPVGGACFGIGAVDGLSAHGLGKRAYGDAGAVVLLREVHCHDGLRVMRDERGECLGCLRVGEVAPLACDARLEP